MVYTKQDFNARVNTVGGRASKSRRGQVATVRKNGLIVAKPKSVRTKLRLPLKGAVLMVLFFVAFKAFLLAANGPDTYQDRLAALAEGGIVGQLGAHVLAVDPVTQLIAGKIGPIIR